MVSTAELYSRAYKAASLVQLDKELKELFPSRPNSGWIGDAAHAARKSEHNPTRYSQPIGSVDALDVYVHGMSAKEKNRILSELKGDPRVWYFIHNGYIWSRTFGWAKRKYFGNPHTGHIHVSLNQHEDARDNVERWFVTARAASKPPTRQPFHKGAIGVRTISHGSRGNDVLFLKQWFGIITPQQRSAKPIVYGTAGAGLVNKIKTWQKSHGLVVDGYFGPKCWAKIPARFKG